MALMLLLLLLEVEMLRNLSKESSGTLLQRLAEVEKRSSKGWIQERMGLKVLDAIKGDRGA